MSERREGGGGGREGEKGRTYLLTRKRERRGGETGLESEEAPPSLLGLASALAFPPSPSHVLEWQKESLLPLHTIHKDEATKKGEGIEGGEEAAKVNFEETAKSG